MAKAAMKIHCTAAKANVLAAETSTLMESRKIKGLVITDDDNKPIGALNMHDLLRAGVL